MAATAPREKEISGERTLWNKTLAGALSATVKTRADKSLASFTLHDEIAERQERFALLHRSEIKIGRLMGTGAFSEVYEVENIQLKRNRRRRLNSIATEACQQSVRDTENNRLRYVIKFLKPNLFEKKPAKFCMAASELAIDAYFLSALSHPHIAKIHGWASSGISAYGEVRQHDGYFLLLERLDFTLETKINSWKDQQANIQNMAGAERRFEQLASYSQRARTAMQVASAMVYVHGKNIIFRDLKPSNIGFDHNGDAKIFDFGIAREVPRSHNPVDDNGENETYEMTGKVGTVRYMAPECFMKQKYNIKADVYSFAVVLYEMLSLVKPYFNMSKDEHKLNVCEKEERPEIPGDWPELVRDLLQRAWSAEIEERPTMSIVQSRLMDIIQDFEAAITEAILAG